MPDCCRLESRLTGAVVRRSRRPPCPAAPTDGVSPVVGRSTCDAPFANIPDPRAWVGPVLSALVAVRESADGSERSSQHPGAAHWRQFQLGVAVEQVAQPLQTDERLPAMVAGPVDQSVTLPSSVVAGVDKRVSGLHPAQACLERMYLPPVPWVVRPHVTRRTPSYRPLGCRGLGSAASGTRSPVPPAAAGRASAAAI